MDPLLKRQLGRYYSWLSRLAEGVPPGWLPLGVAGELWQEQSNHPARVWLEERAAAMGREIDTTHYLTRNLLRDVVHAAGGVLYTATRVEASLDATQRIADMATAGRLRRSDVPQGISQDGTVQWEYGNLLTWLRTVEERIDRPGRSRGGGRLGLRAALGDVELQRDVRRLLGDYRTTVGTERQLANYSLHASAIPYAGAPAELRDDVVVVPIPDPLAEPVFIFDQFTYQQGRDMRTFTHDSVVATERLIDALLDAFAAANTRAEAARRGKEPAAPGIGLDPRGGASPCP
jgi:hypothetical protein